MNIWRWMVVGFCAALIPGLAGCGGKYQPVTGEVVFTDGSPVSELKGAAVVFRKLTAGSADVTSEGSSASGSLDEKGKFQLGTEDVGDGALAGEYEAVITPRQPAGDEVLPKVIADKYTKFGGFAKTFTVKPGSNHFKLEVEPFKK